MLSGCVVPFLDFFLNRAIEKIVVLLMVQTSGEKTKTHRLDVFETLERLGTTTNLNRCRISEPSTGAWNPPRPFFCGGSLPHFTPTVTTATLPKKKVRFTHLCSAGKNITPWPRLHQKQRFFFFRMIHVSSNKKHNQKQVS